MTIDGLKDEDIRKILSETKTIALIGASDRDTRPSNRVMRFLQSKGYRVLPVNPTIAGTTLYGEKVYESLLAIPSPEIGKIDMVDIFRKSEEALEPTLHAIEICAKFVWMQLGIVNEEAAPRAKKAGLLVVMDRCPSIEYPRLFNRSENG